MVKCDRGHNLIERRVDNSDVKLRRVGRVDRHERIEALPDGVVERQHCIVKDGVTDRVGDGFNRDRREIRDGVMNTGRGQEGREGRAGRQHTAQVQLPLDKGQSGQHPGGRRHKDADALRDRDEVLILEVRRRQRQRHDGKYNRQRLRGVIYPIYIRLDLRSEIHRDADEGRVDKRLDHRVHV